jgi:hypothetical protein
MDAGADRITAARLRAGVRPLRAAGGDQYVELATGQQPLRRGSAAIHASDWNVELPTGQQSLHGDSAAVYPDGQLAKPHGRCPAAVERAFRLKRARLGL